MLINLTELLSSEGKEKTYTCVFGQDTFRGPDGSVYAVTAREPVELRIRSLGDRKLFMEGTAGVTLSIPCGRCLEPVSTPFQLSIEEELDLGEAEGERKDDPDAQHYVSGFNLDVDQLLCNELLPALPMKVLCKEDCQGICNRCGTNLNHGICSCDQSSPDPRMSVIQDIFQKYKEV